jgi:phosphoribosylformylglycinamidine synthase
VYEAVRNVVAVGARPLGLTDCLNFGNPRNVEHYGELVSAIDGLRQAAQRFETPFVSGNVSLYNESAGGKAIPASPIVSCVGALDLTSVVSMSFKAPGSVVYLVGIPKNSLGASVLLDVLGRSDERLPHIDYERAIAHHRLLNDAARAHLLRSMKSIGNGGLAVALAEMAFPTLAPGRKTVGAQIDDAWQWTHGTVGNLEAYFGEAGGFVVEVNASDVEAFEGMADDVDGVYEIGVTIDRPVLAIDEEAFDLQRLHDVWSAPLAEIYP